MPAFLETVFGKKKPTAATASAELTRLEAELAAAPARIARADAKLKRVADLTDEEHAAAEADLAAAKRSLVRLQAQVADLSALAVAAEKSEAAAALRTRAEAADRAMRRDYLSAVAEYEAAAALTAEKAAALDAIDHEVRGTNYAIKLAQEADPNGNHPEFVKTSTERYRTKPDVVVPDREILTKQWFVGKRPCMVTVEWNGTSGQPKLAPSRARSSRSSPAKRGEVRGWTRRLLIYNFRQRDSTASPSGRRARDADAHHPGSSRLYGNPCPASFDPVAAPSPNRARGSAGAALPQPCLIIFNEARSTVM